MYNLFAICNNSFLYSCSQDKLDEVAAMIMSNDLIATKYQDTLDRYT